MKKVLILLSAFIITLAITQATVNAGGDKVQGDLGQGEVVQEGPCPFGADTPAGPNN